MNLATRLLLDSQESISPSPSLPENPGISRRFALLANILSPYPNTSSTIDDEDAVLSFPFVCI